jgi:hypothetical protein
VECRRGTTKLDRKAQTQCLSWTTRKYKQPSRQARNSLIQTRWLTIGHRKQIQTKFA